jgi:hypothetical protein
MIFKNFAVTTVATAPTPATTGTSLTVATSAGVLFPDTPFNATVWPIGAIPLVDNAEIVKVTNITGDVFTITRQQESTNSRAIQVGDQIAATITAKTAHDIKNLNSVETSASPYTVQELDDAIICKRLTDMDVYIPAATGSERIVHVKNIEDVTVYIVPDGFDFIDGENVSVEVYQWETITVMDYDVGKWIII